LGSNVGKTIFRVRWQHAKKSKRPHFFVWTIRGTWAKNLGIKKLTKATNSGIKRPGIEKEKTEHREGSSVVRKRASKRRNSYQDKGVKGTGRGKREQGKG